MNEGLCPNWVWKGRWKSQNVYEFNTVQIMSIRVINLLVICSVNDQWLLSFHAHTVARMKISSYLFEGNWEHKVDYTNRCEVPINALSTILYGLLSLYHCVVSYCRIIALQTRTFNVDILPCCLLFEFQLVITSLFVCSRTLSFICIFARGQLCVCVCVSGSVYVSINI